MLGLKENGGIIITYQRNLPAKIFPLADAWFNTIKLPVYHDDKDTYFPKWMKVSQIRLIILDVCESTCFSSNPLNRYDNHHLKYHKICLILT